jgi:LysR family transcriptional regulator, glycine cleavage system transcriptional activator
VAGLGVALLPEFLFVEELRRGDLVPVTTSRVQSRESYHFVWPTHKGGNESMAGFREWLLDEVARKA